MVVGTKNRGWFSKKLISIIEVNLFSLGASLPGRANLPGQIVAVKVLLESRIKVDITIYRVTFTIAIQRHTAWTAPNILFK